MKLTNKTILITGASSGIGKAAALRFSEDKCNLILAARKQPDLDEVKKLCEEKGAKVKTVICDVTKEEDIKNLFSGTEVIDAVFNNAGIGFIDYIYQQDTSKIKTVLDTNVTGMIMVTRYASEYMMKQKHGHIIMTSSLAGLVPIPKWSVYVASKWAITGFTESIRAELSRFNIKVSSLHPGIIKTEFWDRGSIDYNPATATSVEAVANAVYSALFTNKHKIYIPFYVRIVYSTYRWFPWLAQKLINSIG